LLNLNNDNYIEIKDIDDFDSSELETLLHKILHHVKLTLNCEAGSIYLKKNNELLFSVFQNDTLSYEQIFLMQQPVKEMKFTIEENTNTIEMESYLESKIIMIDDVYEDNSYDLKSIKDYDKEFDYKTTSVLTIPLIDTFEDETIGIIQLTNKKENENTIPFTKKDKEFIASSIYFIVLNIINAKDNIIELKQNSLELESKIDLRTKELLETQVKLQEQAHRDPLTNLYNRRHFKEISGSLFSMSRRGNSPLSILIIDIDNFKNVNDTYGHHIGDLVIKSLSNIFINTIRQSDIAIRYGGEEFLLLLTNTNIDNACVIAEKLRSHVENTTIKSQHLSDLKFTISLGLSIVKKDDADIDVAIQEASKALYIAKETGKNKIISI
jgi:diguanylate cyclase (GGDEF)-like protein